MQAQTQVRTQTQLPRPSAKPPVQKVRFVIIGGCLERITLSDLRDLQNNFER